MNAREHAAHGTTGKLNGRNINGHDAATALDDFALFGGEALLSASRHREDAPIRARELHGVADKLADLLEVEIEWLLVAA